MCEIFSKLGDGRVDRYFVLPLEFRPHFAELSVRATGRNDVIHYVNVNVV